MKYLATILFVILSLQSSLTYAEPPTAKIINGSSTNNNWPWIVSLAYDANDTANSHFCGGSLINSQFVLTAAHCVVDITPQNVQVVLGRTKLTDSTGMVIQAEEILVHPLFDENTMQNDLALIRLSAPAPYPTLPLLTKAEEQKLPANTQLRILGWGLTDTTYDIRPLHLQEAAVPLVSSTRCLNSLGLDFDPSSMICAGILATSSFSGDGVDTCSGDSGGPLIVETSEGWKLIGLTSWGYDCASAQYYGVYSRVPAFYEWANSPNSSGIFSIQSPHINGNAQVGNKLECQSGLYGGESLQDLKVSWIDIDSGQTLSDHAFYTPKALDIGRRVACQVNLTSVSTSSVYLSDPLEAVLPRQSSSRLRALAAKIVQKSFISCDQSSCYANLYIKNVADSIRALALPSDTCATQKCLASASWQKASRSKKNIWRVRLPAGRKNNIAIYVRGSNSKNTAKDFVFEIDL